MYSAQDTDDLPSPPYLGKLALAAREYEIAHIQAHAARGRFAAQTAAQSALRALVEGDWAMASLYKDTARLRLEWAKREKARAELLMLHYSPGQRSEEG